MLPFLCANFEVLYAETPNKQKPVQRVFACYTESDSPETLYCLATMQCIIWARRETLIESDEAMGK